MWPDSPDFTLSQLALAKPEEAYRVKRWLQDLTNCLVGYRENQIEFLENGLAQVVIGIWNHPKFLVCYRECAIILHTLARAQSNVGGWADTAGEALVQVDATTLDVDVRIELLSALNQIYICFPLNRIPISQQLVRLLGYELSLANDKTDYHVIRQQILAAQIIRRLDLSLETQKLSFSPKILIDLLNIIATTGPILWEASRRAAYDPLYLRSHSRLTYSSLMAIANIIRGRIDAGNQCATYQSPRLESIFRDSKWPVVDLLFKLVRSYSSTVKLASIIVLTNLFRAGSLDAVYVNSLLTIVLPVLIRLFDVKGVCREMAPYVLSYLVSENEAMQKGACDAGAIKQLASILKAPGAITDSDKVGIKLIQGTFEAVAAVTLFKDEYRKEVIDAGLLPQIVLAMTHTEPQIRVAACLCVRSLSRSVSILRTALVDAGIAKPLFSLLTDEEMSVKVAGCAALCNMILEFSPVRQAIIDAGVIDIICRHAHDEHDALRLNAVWAFKHLMYAAEKDLRDSALKQLDTNFLLQLCDDDVLGVQEQAVDVIRNVCSREDGLEPLLETIGTEKFIGMIKSKLASPYPEIIVPAVFTVVHIAAMSDCHRQLIMQDEEILLSILSHLDHDRVEIRIACVWMVINLTWVEDGSSQHARCKERAAALINLGYGEKLRALKDDPSLDMRERVNTSLAHLGALAP